jgi:hypothetical protein
MSEGILSLEDKEFISSLGNWTGDATWDPGPIGGWTGLAMFVLPEYPDIVTLQLSYPNVKTPKNKPVGFVIYTHVLSPHNFINRRLRITDGVYEFIRDWDYQQFPDHWLAVGLGAALPADWDKLNVSIFLDLQNAELGVTGLAYADRASLNWESLTQYLPIMGVG